MYQTTVGATMTREQRAERAAARRAAMRKETRRREHVEVTAAQWAIIIVVSFLIGALFALVDPDFSESRTQAIAAVDAEWSQSF